MSAVKLLVIAFLAACGGHSETTQQPTTPPPVAEQPKPAGPKPITTDDDYIAKGSELTNRLIAIFKADGTDCDKLADDLDTLHADTAVMDAYDKDHPEVKAKLEAAMEPRQAEVMGAIAPAMNACAGNAKFKAVLQKP